MKQVHILASDLFLPLDVPAVIGKDLRLPALEMILARAESKPLPAETLEAWLCKTFGVEALSIAPITLLADGFAPGDAYWMRADPVHFRLEQSRVILQSNVHLDMEQAQRMCSALNEHFKESGMQFIAPTPLRWYLRLSHCPQLETTPLTQADGRDVSQYFPKGGDALRWHGILNEIQMLFHADWGNPKSASQGGLPVNGVWLWGGGSMKAVNSPFEHIAGNSDLAHAFAQVANVSRSRKFDDEIVHAQSLYVWEGASEALRKGDFHAWRNALIEFEQKCARPLLRALKKGELDRITLNAVQENHSESFELTRYRLWRFWRQSQSFSTYQLENPKQLR